MDARTAEWLKQADYDMETAEFMANIATRYPDDIEKLKSNYTEQVTVQILTQAKGTLEWIRQQF